jgi:hypothetical protein
MTICKTCGTENYVPVSLSRRDQFAMAALNGILASDGIDDWDRDALNRLVVMLADALIAELAKGKANE